MKNKNLFITCLIIIMLIATVLVGCGGNQETDEQAMENTAAVSQEAESEKEKAAKKEESSETVTETAVDDKASDTTKSKETEKTTTATKATENKSGKSNASNEKAKETTKSASKPTQQATKATEASKTCTISIDGYCNGKSIEIKTGDSVYDILQKSGASVSARSTGYGLYVEGINGRFEFDEGPTSGWVYTVNGSRPSMSCDKYEVKTGDKIVWTYVEEV